MKPMLAIACLSFLLLLLASLATCSTERPITKQPLPPPSAMPAILAAQAEAQGIAATLQPLPASLQAHSAAIDAAVVAGDLAKTAAETASIRSIAQTLHAAWVRTTDWLAGWDTVVSQVKAQDQDHTRSRKNERAAIAAAVVARRKQRAAESEAATAKAERDQAVTQAAKSKMLQGAMFSGGGILLGIAIAAIGLFVFKSMEAGIAGLMISGISFIGVLIFSALAWVMAHLWLVIGITAGVATLIGILYWVGRRKGWLRFRNIDGGIKLLKEAVKSGDMAQVKEAFAVLRTDPDIEKSYRATP